MVVWAKRKSAKMDEAMQNQKLLSYAQTPHANDGRSLNHMHPQRAQVHFRLSQYSLDLFT